MAVALLGLIWRAHRRLLTERVSRAALLPTRECAQLALDVEQAWQAQGGVMGAMWAKHASSWRRAARRARDVALLSRSLAELEQHVRAGAQLQAWMGARRSEWQREVLHGTPDVERLTALVAELRDSVIVVGRSVDSGSGATAPLPPTESSALLDACRSIASQHSGPAGGSNTLSIQYWQLYAHLLRINEHAAPFVRGDEHSQGIACGVAMPSVLVPAPPPRAQGAAANQMDGGAPVPVPVPMPVPVPVVAEGVVLAVAVEALDERFATLKRKMREAATDFERIELVRELQVCHLAPSPAASLC